MSQSLKAGFLGLGVLGSRLAADLIAGGVSLVVWNRTRLKAEALKGERTIAETPAEVASGCDIIFLNLFNSQSVSEVTEGPEGLGAAGLRGKVIVDTTTNSVEAAREFHNTFEQLGAFYIEAPVLTRTDGRTFLAGGPKEAYQRALPYLKLIGARIMYFSAPGEAATMKLLNNTVMGVIVGVLSEALNLARSSGFSDDDTVKVLQSGAVSPFVSEAVLKKLSSGDLTADFSASLMHKDLGYAENLARKLDKTLLTGSVARKIYEMAVQSGEGERDFTIIKNILDRSRGFQEVRCARPEGEK